MRIAIIGAGQAGVAAAAALARAGVDKVVLYGEEPYLPYHRSRLLAWAFGQIERSRLDVHPREWYEEQGIELRLGRAVQSIDAEGKIVVADSHESYDALILAPGTSPLTPPYLRGNRERVIGLWSLRQAERLRQQIRRGGHLVVIGAHALGCEAASRALEAGMTVDIVEPVISPKGPKALSRKHNDTPTLIEALEKLGAGLVGGRSVVGAKTREDQQVELSLDNGAVMLADLVLMFPHRSRPEDQKRWKGLFSDGGLRVDRFLQTDVEGVFACGDAIQVEGVSHSSSPEARRQGRRAAENALKFLQGEEMRPYWDAEELLNFATPDFRMDFAGDLPAQESIDLLEAREMERLMILKKVEDSVEGSIDLIESIVEDDEVDGDSHIETFSGSGSEISTLQARGESKGEATNVGNGKRPSLTSPVVRGHRKKRRGKRLELRPYGRIPRGSQSLILRPLTKGHGKKIRG